MKRIMKNMMQQLLSRRPHKAGLVPRIHPEDSSRGSHTDEGFTLIEVVMALAVVSIGLTAVLGLLPGAIQSGRTAADNTLAATIAQDAFSQMRLGALTAWPPSSAGPYYCDATATNLVPTKVLTGPSSSYFQIQVISQLSPSTPNLYVITATVTWPALSTTPINTNIFVTEIAQYQ